METRRSDRLGIAVEAAASPDNSTEMGLDLRRSYLHQERTASKDSHNLAELHTSRPPSLQIGKKGLGLLVIMTDRQLGDASEFLLRYMALDLTALVSATLT